MKTATHRSSLITYVPLLAALLLCGCGSGPKPADQPGAKAPPAEPIVVLCGGSFRPPMEQLAKQYEQETGRKLTLSFGQSEDLLPQVKLKANGDAFLSHDPYMRYAEDAGSLTRFVVVGYVMPVLVVAPGNPKGLKTLDDLAQSGLKVGLPNPEYSTCGQIMAEVFEQRGIKAKVMENAGNALFRSHGEIATAIQLGQRDAGVMWNGMAHERKGKIEIVPGAVQGAAETRVAVMGLSYSKNAAAVEAFLKFCESKGQTVFEQYGYVK
jgi:molybdenum ABC transporter molybdate-binding protein